jgi:hypothetical protein
MKSKMIDMFDSRLFSRLYICSDLLRSASLRPVFRARLHKYSILPSCHQFHQGTSCINIQTKALPYCCVSDGVRELGNEVIDVSQVLTRVFQSLFDLAQHRAYRAQPVQAVLPKLFQFVVEYLIDLTQRCLRIDTDLKIEAEVTAFMHGERNVLAADRCRAVLRGTPGVKSHIQV